MFNIISSQLSVLTGLFVGLATLGCAGPAQITVLQGTCEQNFERCRTRCNLLEDGQDCELRCRFQGKLCARGSAVRAASTANSMPRLTEHAALVDLAASTPLHSKNVRLNLSGGVTHRALERGKQKEFAHVVTPGSSISMTYTLPANVTSVELVLFHGPIGDAPQCFITALLDAQTLLGRYSPPRSVDGRVLRYEKWDISHLVAKTKLVEGMRTFTFFINNNAAAGSKDRYAVASIELYYQVER